MKVTWLSQFPVGDLEDVAAACGVVFLHVKREFKKRGYDVKRNVDEKNFIFLCFSVSKLSRN